VCDSLGDEWLAYLPDDSPDSAPPRSVFIPAPPDCSDDEALEWHLATRNFLAFCHTVPIVGITLGQAIISLHKRLELWRPGDEDNTRDVVAYLDSVGYLSFPHCPDYALAALLFAEHAQLEGLWTDAFAHAVGMSKMLPTSVDLAVSTNENMQISLMLTVAIESLGFHRQAHEQNSERTECPRADSDICPRLVLGG
jgi:hypothetical protein